jgi:hypothetical protein
MQAVACRFTREVHSALELVYVTDSGSVSDAQTMTLNLDHLSSE